MKKNTSGFNFFYILFIILAGMVLLNSCRKDDDDDRREENEHFLELMDEWYYWYDEMPAVNPGDYPSPYELLEALRYRPDDRWSYITSRREFESYYQESKFIGYGFGSAFDSEGKLRITFVYSSSDLYDNDIRRGWIIEKVNGTTIQPGTRINQLLGPNEIGETNTFVFIAPDGSEKELTFAKKELVMNTVLHWGIIETGNNNIGHLVFQGFTGPSRAELDEAFAEFKARGIDDLILDLRYNGGGQTNVANYLASMIGGENLAGEPFALYQYNDKKEEDENFTQAFETVQINLGLDRLITITTRSTASASEMVINGLKPFVPVYIIGDNTYGKPMGMNAWYYGSQYAFVPVTFKIANADGEGDYFEGLQASSYVADDVTRPFDDLEEASLKEALNFIETGSFSGIARTKSLFIQPRELMRGLRQEIGAH